MPRSKVITGVLVGLCLALALAACQPVGSASGTPGSAAPTRPPAPINVPPGYQGLVRITFSAATTYDQAVSILQSAGMKLQVPCPNPGPITVEPPVTPRPISQQDSFAHTHTLTAIGVPHLTRALLNQVASSAQVTAIEKAPLVACPLLS